MYEYYGPIGWPGMIKIDPTITEKIIQWNRDIFFLSEHRISTWFGYFVGVGLLFSLPHDFG